MGKYSKNIFREELREISKNVPARKTGLSGARQAAVANILAIGRIMCILFTNNLKLVR